MLVMFNKFQTIMREKIVEILILLYKIKHMSSTYSMQDIVTQVRRDILRMVHKVNSGHPGGSLGCDEFLVSLYNEVLDLKEGFDMNGTN